ncbi:MAG: DUF4280 domain-containing protein [Gracilibacteraceae bacterium]|jgi:hypothetical protein|nr:DUF4280 domain-containing protein [Gracilibacteraceae bacterium]
MARELPPEWVEVEKRLEAAAKLRIAPSPPEKQFSDEDHLKAIRKARRRNPVHEFLVRGAYLRCNFGTHGRRLNLFLSHGVYSYDRPLVNENDCTYGEGKHVTTFGICGAPDCPRSASVRLFMEEYDPITGYRRPDAGKSVTGCPCQIRLIGKWRDPHKKFTFDGGKAVTTNSFLCCEFGGVITPITSGQDYLRPLETKSGKRMWAAAGGAEEAMIPNPKTGDPYALLSKVFDPDNEFGAASSDNSPAAQDLNMTVANVGINHPRPLQYIRTSKAVYTISNTKYISSDLLPISELQVALKIFPKDISMKQTLFRSDLVTYDILCENNHYTLRITHSNASLKASNSIALIDSKWDVNQSPAYPYLNLSQLVKALGMNITKSDLERAYIISLNVDKQKEYPFYTTFCDILKGFNSGIIIAACDGGLAVSNPYENEAAFQVGLMLGSGAQKFIEKHSFVFDVSINLSAGPFGLTIGYSYLISGADAGNYRAGYVHIGGGISIGVMPVSVAASLGIVDNAPAPEDYAGRFYDVSAAFGIGAETCWWPDGASAISITLVTDIGAARRRDYYFLVHSSTRRYDLYRRNDVPQSLLGMR